MKLLIDADILGSTLKSLQRLVAATSLAFEAKKGILYVTGTGNGNSCMMSVPCKVTDKKGAASFAIDANNLLLAINKRKELEFDVQESVLFVRSKGYEAEILIHQFEATVVVPDDVKTTESLKLKSSFINTLREVLPKIELTPLIAMMDYVPIGIRASKEGTFVSCFDRFQSSFYYNEDLKGKCDFVVPANVFSTIAREIKDQDYQISVSPAAIYAWNDMFELAFALPQQEGDQITLDQAFEVYSSVKKLKGFQKMTFKTSEVQDILGNAKAIDEKGSSLSVATKGKQCMFTLKSNFGTVKGKVSLSEEPAKDITFTCDYNFFNTLLAKAPATLTLRVSDTMILFGNKPVMYLLGLV